MTTRRIALNIHTVQDIVENTCKCSESCKASARADGYASGHAPDKLRKKRKRFKKQVTHPVTKKVNTMPYIISKRDGICAECGDEIAAGDPIYYNGKAYDEKCGEAEFKADNPPAKKQVREG